MEREGLTEEEAARRLAADGPNELGAAHRRGFLSIAGDVLAEPMFLMLLAAGGIYLLLGDVGEAIMLLVFANLSVAIAIVQEVRSERILDALRELTVPTAVVIRSGAQRQIPARELVRGDLVVVAEGVRIPADALLLSGAPLEIDESLLTGESVPVRKRNATEGDQAAPPPGGDDQPWLFSGTLVARGQGRAEVTATGAASAIGRIGHAIESIRAEPPRLHAHTRRLVRIFGGLGAALSVLVLVLYVWLRGSFVDGLLAGIAVGMSLLPEEFPLILSVFMVMGAWRISRARVLTRQAAAIESLGATTVLCTDKTGTLTRNHMVVVALASPADGRPEQGEWGSWHKSEAGAGLPQDLRRTLEAALLASSRDAVDPMDRAVRECVEAHSADPASRDRGEILAEFGLAADLPAMTTVVRAADGSLRAAVKGAPEAVSSLCSLGAAACSAILEQVDRLARDGIRVLAVGEATIDGEETPASPRGIPFSFLGLVGFADPVREGVPEAVAECLRAGVRVAMITGDYPATALAIARDAGIRGGRVVTGSELEALPPDELAARIGDCSVFARIQPEQKLRIVDALKARGDIVAMIGDGVNDAPALRSAHIGVAMGKRGTDVAREASGIVLLDDDFRAIVTTIRLGRRIYDNLRKAMGYVVALHLPIAGLAVLPLLFGLPLLLTPAMIAFLEMIIDPVCSVVFESEPEEPDIMLRPPRDPQSPILPPALILWCAVQGLVAFLFVAGFFAMALRSGESEAEIRATVFACILATNSALLFINRSFHQSSRDALRRPNRLVWLSLGLTAAMFAVVNFWAPARGLFHLGELHSGDLAMCLGAGVLTYVSLQLLRRWWHPPLAV